MERLRSQKSEDGDLILEAILTFAESASDRGLA